MVRNGVCVLSTKVTNGNEMKMKMQDTQSHALARQTVETQTNYIMYTCTCM